MMTGTPTRPMQWTPTRLKGLTKCADCGLPMWAQTYTNERRYYREQRGSRGWGKNAYRPSNG
ncbi:MAG: recombinase zinc beta ribbon domain-containing protein [Chloroflexi bacterium]|nr:recombinase zinc beta ribbon domain-containing protein [Chloroflexota bacterium]